MDSFHSLVNYRYNDNCCPKIIFDLISLHFLGFLIYFFYGIKNSTEGLKIKAMKNSTKRDSYKEVTKF